MKTLFILNDAPYGGERSYNGLRLAGALSKAQGEEVKLFLIGDAVSRAKDAELVDGTRRSTLAELTAWTQWADKATAF